MKILVCDDSIVNRQMGHDTIFAENGEQAIALFGQENPDLVLIDVEMPGMNGYEATVGGFIVKRSLNTIRKSSWI